MIIKMHIIQFIKRFMILISVYFSSKNLMHLIDLFVFCLHLKNKITFTNFLTDYFTTL